MNRIIALNEDSCQAEDEIKTSNEAQEAIAEFEYIRALKLKSRDPDLTLSLLSELLETKVLNEISVNNKNDKLLSILYNCHKNIAKIYEEKGLFEKALEYYNKAIQIDSSDVYTTFRMGKLALQIKYVETAEFAFEHCLKRNPTHWSAEKGMLDTFCYNFNILGSYGLAVRLKRNNPNYKNGINTLKEIRTMFKNLMPFYEKLMGTTDIPTSNTSDEHDKGILNVFKPRNPLEELHSKDDDVIDLMKFRISSPNWISIGEYIIAVYKHLQDSKANLFHILKIADMLVEGNSIINGVSDNRIINTKDEVLQEVTNDSKKSENQNSNSSEANGSFTIPSQLDDQQNGSDPNESKNENNKPKVRRRCSDLDFLEQWGWHKNRRYSSRKKPQDKNEVDTTLKGSLQRMFGKFTNNSFEDPWPFKHSDPENICHSCAALNEEIFCELCKIKTSDELFIQDTNTEFDKFFLDLKKHTFDFMALIYKWLENISSLWNKKLPENITRLYLQIFDYYLEHFDLSLWNHSSHSVFKEFYRINLLYLEIKYSELLVDSSHASEWKILFDRLIFNCGTAYIVSDQKLELFKIRLANLEYLWWRMCEDLEKCLHCLCCIESTIAKQSNSFILHLPNLNSVCISKKTISNSRVNLKRQISLNNILMLFEKEDWATLVDVVSHNIIHLRDDYQNENWLKDFKIQMEILLESLWTMNVKENCLIWAEKFIHYVVCHYLSESKYSSNLKIWVESINILFTYLEALISKEGFEILSHLEDHLSRLIQNSINLLSHKLDCPYDANNSLNELNLKLPWVVLYQIMLREENNKPQELPNENSESDENSMLLTNSQMLLFSGHEFLGKHQWCSADESAFLFYILDAIVPNIRAPLYDANREHIYEYIEQVTYCLYGYPAKKGRCRHLEDHEAQPVRLTWSKAVQLFDLYKPESLPEFNSYKLESITMDMEQLLLKIISIMPLQYDVTNATTSILKFIEGEECIKFDDHQSRLQLPYKINIIYYLLADYYFKTHDFSKAIKYYTMDLVDNSTRFDSWAGIALSKSSKIETKMNSLNVVNLSILLSECEETIRCFERCINLNRNQITVWIEYGSFTYTLHSYYSRHLKQSSENMSIEEFSSIKERKGKMLTIAYNCFSMAITLQSAVDVNGESCEDKWLCQYMLGKISEKQKEHPKIYLDYYMMSANSLYESGATYPIKINHSNPTTFSVEALEIFYRTNAVIMKYLEQEKEITHRNVELFKKILKTLAKSPFAFNKAKINDNSLNTLKRKIPDKFENLVPAKQIKESTTASDKVNDKLSSELITAEVEAKSVKLITGDEFSRRESQESNAGTGTTLTSSATSSINSSKNNSSTSESDSDSDGSLGKKGVKKLKPEKESIEKLQNDVMIIYEKIVQNLEECITRFPEHYKSMYRLVNHFLNGPSQFRNVVKCEKLLFGQYKTNLGNVINGLFYDRKNNNFFNGIWRIPSSEIDRPGSFSAHLMKCVSILTQTLLKTENHKLLIDIGLQLYKTPDNDKRYIKDIERMELYQQCMTYYSQVMRNILKKIAENRNDAETIDFLVEIYKTYKKCNKYMNQKEALLSQLLIDVYKVYLLDKVEKLPPNLNFLDLSIKLCVQEITNRRNSKDVVNLPLSHINLSNVPNIPGVGYLNYSAARSLSSQTQPVFSIRPHTFNADNKMITPVFEKYGTNFSGVNPASINTNFDLSKTQTQALGSKFPSMDTNAIVFHNFVADYYKSMLGAGKDDKSTNYLPSSLSMTTTTVSLDNTISYSNPQIAINQSNPSLMSCDPTITPTNLVRQSSAHNMQIISDILPITTSQISNTLNAYPNIQIPNIRLEKSLNTTDLIPKNTQCTGALHPINTQNMVHTFSGSTNRLPIHASSSIPPIIQHSNLSSSTITLQQKLIERQLTNQLPVPSNNKDDGDIIVLD